MINLEQRFLATYIAWDAKERMNTKRFMIIYANDKQAAIRKAEEKLRAMEEYDNEFSYLDISVTLHHPIKST